MKDTLRSMMDINNNFVNDAIIGYAISFVYPQSAQWRC